MFASHAYGGVSAISGAGVRVGQFDGLIVVAEPEGDHVEFVDDVRLSERDVVVVFVAQSGDECVERRLQFRQPIVGQAAQCLLEHEAGGEKLPAGLRGVAAEGGHGWDRSEQGAWHGRDFRSVPLRCRDPVCQTDSVRSSVRLQVCDHRRRTTRPGGLAAAGVGGDAGAGSAFVLVALKILAYQMLDFCERLVVGFATGDRVSLLPRKISRR